jgi:hypothetical protein
VFADIEKDSTKALRSRSDDFSPTPGAFKPSAKQLNSSSKRHRESELLDTYSTRTGDEQLIVGG